MVGDMGGMGSIGVGIVVEADEMTFLLFDPADQPSLEATDAIDAILDTLDALEDDDLTLGYLTAEPITRYAVRK